MLPDYYEDFKVSIPKWVDSHVSVVKTAPIGQPHADISQPQAATSQPQTAISQQQAVLSKPQAVIGHIQADISQSHAEIVAFSYASRMQRFVHEECDS